MKSSLVKSLLLGTALTCATASFAMAEDYNWSGIFLGGTVGATDSKSDSTVDYTTGMTEDDGETYNQGWTNGNYFTGALYNDLDELNMTNVATPSNSEDTSTASSPAIDELDTLVSWLDSSKTNEMDWSATAILGAQMVSGGLVFGAELRGTFGNFDTSTSDEWVDQETADGFASCAVDDQAGNDDATCSVTYTPVGTNVEWDHASSHNPWSLNSNGGDAFVASGYEVEYNQVNRLSFGANYDSTFSPVAKLGVAAGRVHLFAMGGPTWSKVTAVTSAQSIEDAHVDVYTSSDNTFDDVGDFTGNNAVGNSYDTLQYDWSGSNTETMAGYSVGGGMEWAATDNLVLRAEGLYTNLGSIDVTGVSNETSATYTVSQDLTSMSGSVGMLIKF